MINDNNGKQFVHWSSKRNENERLRHRPHIINTANNRGNANIRYFSSIDADIYFGDIFIDEVVSIAWQVQENALPIFGYNSYTFDDIAVGNRLVSGQLVVNFTQSNYLTKVLQTMKKISRQMYGSDVPAKSKFSEPDRQRRNLPIWDAGFDVVVGFGEKNNVEAYEQVVTLDCCQLTGCAQQLDANGEPITETYSFIARDIKYSGPITNDDYLGRSKPKFESSKNETINFTAGNLFLNNSEGKIVIQHESSKDIDEAYIFLKDIDNKLFNTGKKMKLSTLSLEYNLTPEEKNAVVKYHNQNKSKKIDSSIIYRTKSGKQKEHKIALVVYT